MAVIVSPQVGIQGRWQSGCSFAVASDTCSPCTLGPFSGLAAGLQRETCQSLPWERFP